MRLILFSILVCLGLACTKKNFNRLGGQGQQQDQNAVIPADDTLGTGDEAKNMVLDSTLVWKRYRAFEQGLMAGLELNKAELCMEAGQFSCVDKVHLTVLGGNEPYDNAQYERAEKPSVLTAVAVDRILLTACSKRVELDKAAASGEAVVFKHFPLDGQIVNASQLESQVVDLYRRLLARDPSKMEVATAVEFASQIPSAESLAVALCFAIGTTVENVFL